MSAPRWKRPESVPFPSVWRRFKGQRPLPDGSIPEFRIQDVSDELVEPVLDHMVEHFLRDETLCSCTRLREDPTSLSEIRALWKEMLGHRSGLVALVEGRTDAQGRPIVAGCNVTAVSHKADKGIKFKFQGVQIQKVIDALDYIGDMKDVFEHYGVNEYMTALGLSVAREYRGQGLGIEILRARFDIGRAINLPLTVTIFTAIPSQILAARVGMEVLAEVAYDQYKVDGEVVFNNVTTKTMKLMAVRIE